MNALMAALAGACIGVAGICVGAVVSYAVRKPSASTIAMWMAFAGGLMLAISFVELLPAAALLGGLWQLLAGFEAGVLTVALFSYIIQKRQGASLAATAALLGGAIAIHGIPEGMAIGAGLAAKSLLSGALMLAMLLHGLPEGMAMAAPLRAVGVRPLRVMLYAVLAGAPVGLGAYLGYLLGAASDQWLGGCMAFAGGAMIAVVMRDMMEQAERLDSRAVWMAVLGAGVGAAMSLGGH